MYRLIVICIALLPFCLDAQTDSLAMMNTVGPEAHIISSISQRIELDARPSDTHVADVLARSVGLQIQGQGGSYLRTALYRGQSARHMAILWEGVNIQNQFNGTYDLGLIPSSLFNASKWYSGGHSATLGTAAMSGALVLDQQNSTPQLSAAVRMSDQKNAQYNMQFRFSNKKIKQSVGISFWDNENNYRHQNFNDTERRNNSQHTQKDLSYKATISWSDHWQSKFSYWYQDVERSLPPSIIASTIANQNDINHRFSLGNIWQMASNVSWSSSVAYMNEYLGYFQPGINSESRSDIWNFKSKINFEGNINHDIGVNIRHENGALIDTINPGFQSFFPERTTVALFYNGETSIGKSAISLSLRQELIGSDLQFPTGQLVYRYKYKESVRFNAKVGSNFNYPGFNDLYWPSGGNPDLVTEKSYQVELGADLFGFNATLYAISTTDKILWSPNEQNIWSPENISSTKTNGVELSYDRTIKVKRWEINLSPIVSYNHTVNTSEGSNEGNQLLYNPKLNTGMNLETRYSDWTLKLNHAYTSQRYQSLDNVTALDPYHLLDIELAYQLKINEKLQSKFHLGVKNIFDQSYELVRFYPQPLRSIYIGINISI